MAVETDALRFARHAEFGELGDEDGVGPVAGGLGGPEFAVSGAESDPGVGGGARRNVGEFGAGGAIQEVDSAGVEDSDDAVGGVVGHVHGAAGYDGLLTPRAYELIGRQQPKAP